MVRNLTCIMCPLGCDLVVRTDEESDIGEIMVEGNTCPKGKNYAIQEMTESAADLYELGRKICETPRLP